MFVDFVVRYCYFLDMFYFFYGVNGIGFLIFEVFFMEFGEFYEVLFIDGVVGVYCELVYVVVNL